MEKQMRKNTHRHKIKYFILCNPKREYPKIFGQNPQRTQCMHACIHSLISEQIKWFIHTDCRLGWNSLFAALKHWIKQQRDFANAEVIFSRDTGDLRMPHISHSILIRHFQFNGHFQVDWSVGRSNDQPTENHLIQIIFRRERKNPKGLRERWKG